jgi:hypothetical protein
VPPRNGSVAAAPAGGQRIQAGAALGVPATAAAGDDDVLLPPVVGEVVSFGVAAVEGAPGVAAVEGAPPTPGAVVVLCAAAGAGSKARSEVTIINGIVDAMNNLRVTDWRQRLACDITVSGRSRRSVRFRVAPGQTSPAGQRSGGTVVSRRPRLASAAPADPAIECLRFHRQLRFVRRRLADLGVFPPLSASGSLKRVAKGRSKYSGRHRDETDPGNGG